MAVFPSDSIRTKDWGTEILTDSDLEAQFDLIHTYLQACLNSTSGHSHNGSSNQGPKIDPTDLLISGQTQGDLLYASSAAAWARLGKGTARQVLQMNSGATAPEWVSSGTSANELVRLDSSAKLPAVDGSQLTGLFSASSNIVSVNVGSTGSLSVTGVGFKPSSIVFVLAYTPSNGGQSTGICDAGLSCSSTGSSKQSDATVRFIASSNSILLYKTGTTVCVNFTVTSLDSDGFTISRSTADGSAVCYALCIK